MSTLKFSITLLALGLFTISGYASDAGSESEIQAGMADQVTNPDGQEASAGAGNTDEKEAPLSVMDTPLDGSSEEAFKAGLKLVDEQATEKQYRSVMSALDYLLFYDLDVQRKKVKLYLSLDGQSPNQIIQAVQARRKGK